MEKKILEEKIKTIVESPTKIITKKPVEQQLKDSLVKESIKRQKPKIQVKVTENTSMKVPRVTTQNILCVVILLLAIPGAIIYTNSDWIPSAIYQAEQFNFQVFCPVYYDMHNQLRNQRDKSFTGYIMQHIYPLADKLSIYSQLYGQQQKQIYVVNVLDGQNQTNSTNYGMRYCGLARPRIGTCQKDAKLICTNPGPTFETIKDQQIIVIWVNRIGKLQQKYQKYVSKNLSSCYQIYGNQDERPRFCTLMSKLSQYKHLVYEDPTILPPAEHYRNFTINNLTTPISTYVHGMIVRPTFNGGPLSWFTSRGQVGVGFSTAEKQNYDLMKSVMTRSMKLNQILVKRYKIDEYNYKIDIYHNRQQPANLMYYDSAISVAKKNLMSGLSGFYIIRDKQIEKALPSEKYEHQILIHPSVASSRKSRYISNKTQNDQVRGIAIATSQEYMMFRNNFYRFRIANADFLKMYNNVKFIGTTQQKSNETPIQFWVVGTDSSLLNKPIGPITKLDTIAPAERFDILIKFDKSLNQIVKLVYGDNNELITILYLQQTEVNQGSIPNQIVDAPRMNLSNYQNRVTRRRMRPFSKTSDDHIATNGHLTIFEGQSQDPHLGSIEDWYFINNMDAPQSIHLDLVQFQAIDQYSLNIVPNTKSCTFYDVDFFMKYAQNCHEDMQIGNQSIKPQQFSKFVGSSLKDYQDMCKYIQSLNKTQYTFCFDGFKNQQDNQGPRYLSGIDVQQICEKDDKTIPCSSIFNTNQDNQIIYKYRNEQIKLPQYRKGFKDVQVILSMSYSRIRIRWTRTDFPQKETKQNERERQLFFYASEEQLSEYPGYTYRSTLVKGEQSHMIRPIMTQPNPQGKSKPWRQIFQKLNLSQLKNHRAKIYTSWHDDDDFL